MQILGIETSCDESAAAIVDDEKNILAQSLFSQIKAHREFGGVVPEIAARSHIEILPGLVENVLRNSALKISQLDAIAVTAGPGLIGGVIVGIMVAKGIAAAADKPIIAINHLEGHALTARLISDVQFPYLLLLISGGHCQFVLVNGIGSYQKLGGTIDDAVGEAFDKVAKILNLDYPGGPSVEREAKKAKGNIKFNLPKPLIHKKNLDLSFSGLKTAVKRIAEKYTPEQLKKIKPDLCAEFQDTVIDILLHKLHSATAFTSIGNIGVKNIVIAGGVAANSCLRTKLQNYCSEHNLNLFTPPIKLCTDNAAMIAWAGIERFRQGHYTEMNFPPRSRWPLESCI